MKKGILQGVSLFLIFLFACNVAKAVTNITTSTVSGHWTMAGSPYNISNDITISAGQSLVIDPGVTVKFNGAFYVSVYGTLKAAGTVSQPINFDVQDTTGWYDAATYAGGWKGIDFMPYSSSVPDISVVKYCNLQHMKSHGINLLRTMTISDCNFYNNFGKAIVVTPQDSTVVNEVHHCKVYNNTVALGNLIHIVGKGSSIANVHDMEIRNNSLNGTVFFSNKGYTRFENNSVFENGTNAYGPAYAIIYFQDSKGVVMGNKIYANISHSCGPVFASNSVLDINRNKILNNSHVAYNACGMTDGGGGILLVGDTDSLTACYTVRNNILANNNSCRWGGGICACNVKAIITNNTIVNNKAVQGSGIYLMNSKDITTTIQNNIFYGNQNYGYTTASSDNIYTSWPNLKVRYNHNWTTHSFGNDIWGTITYMGDSLTNIIGTTPGLVAPTITADVTENAIGANFSLVPTSACINTGDSVGSGAYTTDYAGNVRVYGSAIDMGAYEFNPVAWASLGLVQPVISERSVTVSPNPASSIVFVTTPEPKGTIGLVDVSGRLISENVVTNTATPFDVRSIPRGVYFITWANGLERSTRKVVVE